MMMMATTLALSVAVAAGIVLYVLCGFDSVTLIVRAFGTAFHLEAKDKRKR